MEIPGTAMRSTTRLVLRSLSNERRHPSSSSTSDIVYDVPSVCSSLPSQEVPVEGISPSSLQKPSLLKKQKSFRRRVRFTTTPAGNILPSLVIAATPISEEECTRVWYSREELRSIQDNARAVSDFHVRQQPAYRLAMARLISECAKTGASEISLRTHHCIPEIIGAGARGLENTIVPLLRIRRDRSIDAVCKMQVRTRAMSSDKRSHVLALQYRRNCQYAELWARVLADGDALSLAY